MGFDLTGLNPKNVKHKEPKREELFYEQSSEQQEKYFEDLEKYQSQSGTYFRNNCWWWRPLAEYVIRFTKVVSDKDAVSWGFNDCHEVSKEDAEMISQQLDHLISTNHTKDYEVRYNKLVALGEEHNAKIQKQIDKLNNLPRNKDLAPANYNKKDKVEWDRLYNKQKSIASYPFSVKNVKAFSDFCKNSGGFTIG
jgi:hypothetical protein